MATDETEEELVGEDLEDRDTPSAVGRPDTARTETPPHSGERRRFSRRTLFGAGVAAGTAVTMARAGLAGAAVTPAAIPAGAALPEPGASGIDHIVVVMMENRSFDHFLGWLPGANGKQAGLSYPDRSGELHPTYHLTTYQGLGFADPDHSYEGGRIELNGGACDGWLLDQANDEFCIGYYEQSDLAFLGRAAPYWTTTDAFFASTMAETYPNRFYMHSAQTDRLHDTIEPFPSSLPTIWDRLEAAGVGHRYYFSDVPFTAFWGLKYLGISHTLLRFLLDCATGRLPAVSFVDPRFIGEEEGLSGDDHPFGDIRVGEAFLSQVYAAVTSSPNWARTVLVITFDEWGGFFDHVAPSTAPDVSPVTALRGFRVPTLVISPRAPRQVVAHETYDHTSILNMIEWRWNLPPLTPRDAAARNLAEVLDWSSSPSLTSPRWPVPPASSIAPARPTTPAAQAAAARHDAVWRRLQTRADQYGFSSSG